jgi:hypothetical protein
MQSGSILYVTGSLGAVIMFYSSGLILQMTVSFWYSIYTHCQELKKSAGEKVQPAPAHS